jgi:hypothetical protein
MAKAIHSIPQCACGSGMFVKTTRVTSTYRTDWVGNIYGDLPGEESKWTYELLDLHCEKCGAPATERSPQEMQRLLYDALPVVQDQ